MRRKAVWTASMILIGASLAFAQAPAKGAKGGATPAAAPGKAAIEQALIANERKVNEAVMKGDVAAFKALVADDAVAADDGGFMQVSEFTKVMATAAKITEWDMANTRVLWIDANSAVVTYTWTGKGTFMDKPVKSPVAVSSVWTKRAGKWVAVYHQETALEASSGGPAKK